MNRVTELCGHMWTDEAVCALPRRVHGEHLDHAYQAAVLVPLPLDYEPLAAFVGHRHWVRQLGDEHHDGITVCSCWPFLKQQMDAALGLVPSEF